MRLKKFNSSKGTRTYLQIVESYREGGKVKQKVLFTLGRLEKRKERNLDTLIGGLTRFSKNLTVLRVSEDVTADWSKEYGPLLIFRRLWEEVGLPKLLEQYLRLRRIEMDVILPFLRLPCEIQRED